MSDSLSSFQQLETAVELLTQVHPWPSYRKLSPFTLKKQAINLKSLEKLLTEQLYLLCYLYFNPCICFLGKKMLVCNSRSDEEEVRVVLVLEGQQEEAKKAVGGAWEKQFERVELGQGKWAGTMRGCADRMVQCYNECKVKGLILPNRANEFTMKCELDQFCFVYLQQIRPKLHLFRDPPALLRAFQETRLFRENALLYKYSINSITAKVADSKRSQQELLTSISQFQRQRLQFLKSPKAKMQSSDLLIQKLFKQLSISKVISLSTSINDKEEEKSDGKAVRIGRVCEGKTNEPRTLVINISVEEKPYEFLTPPRLEHFLSRPDEEEKPQERKPQQANKMVMNWRINEFQVSYCAVGNQLQVKMLTNHIVRQQQADLVASILHSMNLDSISFAIEEHARKAKNNERCLTLSTKTHLHPKESPFLAIFECIDRLTIFSLVIEPDLRLKAEVSLKRKERIRDLAQHLVQKMRGLIDQLSGN